jgi:hypothetical protein
MPPQRLLRKHELPVDGDFEQSSRRLDQFDVNARVGLLQLSRQTDGSRAVVSDNTILNSHMHWGEHLIRKATRDRRES